MTEAQKDLIEKQQTEEGAKVESPINEAAASKEASADSDRSASQVASAIAGDGAGRSIVAEREAPATGHDGKSERSHPLIELTLARIREFVREPEAVFWTFIFPVLLSFVLGIAFRNTAPEENRIAVEAVSTNDAAAAELARSLSASPDIEAAVLSREEAAQALRTGKVALVVRPDAGDAETRGRKDAATGSEGAASSNQKGDSVFASPRLPFAASGFEYRYDPSRPESRMARLTVDDALQRAFGRSDIAKTSEETTTEPGARYIDWLIPGIIGLNLMGSGMWGLGFAVVYARTRKLLKRFAATPMRRSHYLLSFMLSRLMFLVGEVAAVIVFGWFAFKVAVHGSLIDVAILSLIGAMTFAGLGLLVASRPKTIEGVSGLMNMVMLPMWLLSGVFFSSSRFPDALQPFIKALPLTALNDSLRAVMSEGATLASIWTEITILLAWAFISFALAMKLFRWQ